MLHLTDISDAEVESSLRVMDVGDSGWHGTYVARLIAAIAAYGARLDDASLPLFVRDDVERQMRHARARLAAAYAP